MKLTNFKVATRLAVGFGIVFFGALFLAASGWFGINKQAAMMATAVDRDVAFLRAVTSIRARVQMLRRYEKDMILNVDEQPKAREYKQKWDESRKRLDELLASGVAAASNDEERKRLEQLSASLEKYQTAFDEVA